MKSVIMFISIFSALIFLSCAASKRESISRSDIGGAWTLADIVGEKGVDKIYSEAKIPELNFDANKLRVAGNNGCNKISGKFSLPSKEKIQLSPLISTKMACPGIGNGEIVFMNAMEKVNSYKLNKDELILMENDKELLRFSRKQ